MKQIIAEVDFQHAHPDVALRFYLTDGTRRQQLYLQAVYNFGQRVQKGLEAELSEADGRLLRDLLPQVGKAAVLRLNPNVLRLTRECFDGLARRWVETPERFVERNSGQPYCARPVDGALQIELECQGPQTVLTAMVVTTRGLRVPYHRIAAQFDPHRDEVLIEGQLTRMNFALPRELVHELFASGPRRVPTSKVAEHLPALLEGRVDLLSGPSVQWEEHVAEAVVRVRADGADLLVAVSCGEAGPAPRHGVAYRLELRDGAFIAHRYRASASAAVAVFLAALPLAPGQEGWQRLAGTPPNLAKLLAARAELPETVRFLVAPECQRLFADALRCTAELTVRTGRGWMDVDVSCQAGDLVLTGAELESAVAGDGFCRTRGGEWLRLDRESVSVLAQALQDSGLQLGGQRRWTWEAGALARRLKHVSDLRLHPSATEVFAAVQAREAAPPPPVAESLQWVLREYQRAGIRFLWNRTSYEVGCLLADDMGLGKTLQVLAFLAMRRAQQQTAGPTLIVCPASVAGVWMREAAHYAPDLRLREYRGTPEERAAGLATVTAADVLVATYAVVRNDLEHLRPVAFDTIVLDEAQQIRNPEALVTQATKALTAACRIAVTGTPLENRLLDLWSLMDFLNPGLLGERSAWVSRGAEAAEEVRSRVAPLMLRRRKEEVAPELPSRTVETTLIPLEPAQRELYQRTIAAARTAGEQGTLAILAALTRLRQVCCDPRLLPGAGGDEGSAKLEFLVESVAELLAEGHSVLVFSQFTKMLDLIMPRLTEAGLPFYLMTGETPTPERTRLVEEFSNSPRPEVFLLSLRAAGTGITLSKADYVFIYDPWWNPAVENQAIDRAHRLGQTRPVIAYRLVAAETVEEQVLALQDEKRQLFEATIEAADAGLATHDLRAFFAQVVAGTGG